MSTDLDRRNFLKHTAMTAATASVIGFSSRPAAGAETSKGHTPGIIDTNVNLFDWPFRSLKYRDTKKLVAKLKKHRIVQAWAGSFEALLSKDMNGVNARLAAECQDLQSRLGAPGFLIPFGSVNLAWPDWEDDVRRCHEVHKMPGIRIYPGYQPFDLDHPDLSKLLKTVIERHLILQIVFGMEDPRVHHPLIEVRPVTFAPLVAAMKQSPNAKVQLLHFPNTISNETKLLPEFMKFPNTFVEISRFEGNGGIGRMIGTVDGLPSARAPVERILFGSHAPYFPVETALLKLVESPLTSSELRAIVRENARRLLVAA